jgi:colanic acid biosynthesis protein WcaH
MKIGPRYISEALYKKILSVIPITCVDVVIISGNKFLLGKRSNKPAKGQWFVVGGRIIRGEKLEAAVRRHIKEELGISKIEIKKLLGARETIFKTSAQGTKPHTRNTIEQAEIPFKNYISHDNQNSEFKWFSKIDSKWSGYVKDMLRRAGFQ